MADIRPMRPDELDDVAAFVNVCWRAAYPGILDEDFLAGLTTADRARRMRRAIDGCGATAWVAGEDGDVAGMVVAGPSSVEEYPDDGEIHMLYVHPDHLHTGLGHALITHACDNLARAGHRFCILDVFAGNARAIRFYRSHGFETVRHATTTMGRPGGHGYPLEFMRRPLSPRGCADREVAIRRARDEDLEMVAGFAVALADFNRAHHPPRYTRDDYAPVRLACRAAAEQGFRSRDEDASYLIAEVDGTPIGYALARIVASAPEADNGTGPTGVLDELFVAESARGCGAGTGLLDASLAWLRSRGPRRVRLDAYAWNAPARALYERCGFTVSSLCYDRFLDEDAPAA
ncbi:MAG: GNAT family N-acetyltransferase [Actinomycetia bacterium]|nr:GNAT family N-acetyltransferase [Actinomycetes bacterium]